MPANPIATWTQDWLKQLRQSGQRQLLWLRGPGDWCRQQFSELASLDDHILLFSNAGFSARAIPPAKAATCLGGEASLVVVDLDDGLDPDLLCIAAGLVISGGLLVLLDPDGDKPASRFAEFLRAEFEGSSGVGLSIGPALPLPDPEALAELPATPIVDGQTAEQGAVLAGIERWLAGGDDGVALISADRGRGKSTCLGLLAARLASRFQVKVTARSRQAAAVLLATAPEVEFIAPDHLLEALPEQDLVIVDEAATLPLAMLRRIRQNCRRVVMATTCGGYEGTGSGFRLRFVSELELQGLHEFELSSPVRWRRGDRLEAWLNRSLLLEAPPASVLPTGSVAARSFDIHSRAEAPLVCEAYRLLAAAHYRTRPSDLRRLMDEPGQLLIVARQGVAVIGVAWLVEEGGFAAELCEQVFLGRRRPQGHLLAQMLTAQAGSRGFAGFRGLRVQRIAVAEGYRRQGTGLGLLEQAKAYACRRNLDYLGASFAVDPVSVPFWQRAGFQLAHVGFAAGKSSGNHSIAVLRPIEPAVAVALEQMQARITHGLPLWLTQFLQTMDSADVVGLLRYARYRAGLADIERDEIEAFTRGNRGFELGFAGLQRCLMQRIAETSGAVPDLLVGKAVQNRPWRQLETGGRTFGRKQMLAQLRLQVAELLAGK